MAKISIPVMVADNEGNPIMTVGSGELSNNSLTIKFQDNHIPAMAIERILKRQEPMGLVFVKFEDEEETTNTEEKK